MKISNFYRRRIEPRLPLYWREHSRIYRTLGYWPNLKRPRTFNEIIAGLKLLYPDPSYAMISDKWKVRRYVAERVGTKYLSKVYCIHCPNPSMKEGDRRRLLELDLQACPDQFVAKPTHMSGRLFFCTKKEDKNVEVLYPLISEWLSSSYGVDKGEKWYDEIHRRVLFEEMLFPPEQAELDYKFYVFSGKVKAFHVDFDRFGNHRRAFYTPNSERIPCTLKGYPMYTGVFKAPDTLNEMIEIAEELSRPYLFMRVDLYSIQGRIVFGEMTPTPAGGCARFTPDVFDEIFGSLMYVDPSRVKEKVEEYMQRRYDARTNSPL